MARLLPKSMALLLSQSTGETQTRVATATATDEELARRMFAGDEQATELLLQRYRRPLFGMLYRLTRNPAEAEDLFQETFLRTLRFSASFDRKRRFKPWLFTIALNLARDRARRLAHPASPELREPRDLEPESRGRPGARERQLARRLDLLRAIGELPEHHREVILLRYFEGLEEPEIAASAGIPRGTVKSRLHHAIRKLRAIFEPQEHER